MPAPRPANSAAPRLISLDAYRGFTMLAMVSAGLGTAHLLNQPSWGWLADQLTHRLWEGCTFWDLIQPSFMFIVGVAMPFSFANRQGQGQSFARQLMHAVVRSMTLILIGLFLDAYSAGKFEVAGIQFIRVLQQIAIGYLIAFLIMPLGAKVQAVATLFLLVGHTAAFFIYGKVMGISPWLPGANVGTFLDLLVGLPRSTGNYATFNAVSSAATILIGVLCGELLKGGLAPGQKVAVMLYAGVGLIAVGWGLSGGGGWMPISFDPLVPMIKRIWTSSFALFAAGWTFLMMALFYLLIDVMLVRFWSFPFVVVGMNSIFVYVAAGVLAGVVRRSVGLFVPDPLGKTPPYKPVLMSLAELGVFWLLCFWLYRKKIFFKV